MNKSLLITTLAVVSFFASCRHDVNVTCNTQPTLLLFETGLMSGDSTRCTLFKYQQDNAFDVLIDSTVINNDYGSQVVASDTLAVSVIQTAYDYKLVFTAIQDTFLITGITQGPVTSHTFSVGFGFDHAPLLCYQPLVSFMVNGVAGHPIYSGNTGDPVLAREQMICIHR